MSMVDDDHMQLYKN